MDKIYLPEKSGKENKMTIRLCYADGAEDSATAVAILTATNKIEPMADAAGVLTNDGAGNLSWGAGGSGSPGGSDTYVQYNDSGEFGGDANFTWNKTTRTLFLGGDYGNTPAIILGNDMGFGFSAGDATVTDDPGGSVGIGAGAGNGIGTGGAFTASSGQGGITGDGGPVDFYGGTGGVTSGNGGPVNFHGGDTQGGDSNGGSIVFIAGAGHGAGTNGAFKFIDYTASVYGILDFAGLAASDKTFAFPNVSGSFALGAGTITDSTTNDVTIANHTHAFSGSVGFLGNGAMQYQVPVTGATPFAPAWSGFLLDGTTGGKTVFAVTNTKTLTLTSADTYSLTAEATGAVVVRTASPNIVATPLAGNTRGQYAVDLQFYRAYDTQVASGTHSAVLAGGLNTASGNYSATLAGEGNQALGAHSVASGEGCDATGNNTFAAGTRAKTGVNAGTFIWGDNTGEDFSGIAANEFAIRARGGFRHAYDGSNYWTANVASNGVTTFATLPVGAGFVFTPPVTLSSVTASTFVYANASKVLVSLANATGYLKNDGAGAFSYVAAPLPGAHNVLDSTYHGDVLTGSITRGDILYGNATPKIARLAKGTANAVLTGDGTDTAWSAYFLTGTAGGTTTFAVTNTKTLTLTATDNFNLTVPATGTAVLGSGASARIPYFTDANTVASGLYFDYANNRLGIGAASGYSNLLVQGTQAVSGLYNTSSASTNNVDIFIYYLKNSAGTGMEFGRMQVQSLTTTAGAERAGYLFGIRMAGQSNSSAFQIYPPLLASTAVVGALFRPMNDANAGVAAFELDGNLTDQTAGAEVGAMDFYAYNAGTPSAIARMSSVGLYLGGAVTPTTLLHAVTPGNTAGIKSIVTLDAARSAAGANADGGSILLNGKTSTTAAQAMGLVNWQWVDATHASRKAKVGISAYDTAVRSCIEFAADGVAGITRTIAAVEGAYATTAIDLTLTSAHHWVKVTSNVTVTLPTAVGITGREYIITATASGVIVDGSGSETINGELTQTLSAGETIRIKSDNENWFVT